MYYLIQSHTTTSFLRFNFDVEQKKLKQTKISITTGKYFSQKDKTNAPYLPYSGKKFWVLLTWIYFNLNILWETKKALT